jgi:hypothetical protein
MMTPVMGVGSYKPCFFYPEPGGSSAGGFRRAVALQVAFERQILKPIFSLDMF